MGDYELSKNSKKNIKGINKDLEKLVVRVLKKSDHDFGIPKSGGNRVMLLIYSFTMNMEHVGTV